MVAGGDTADDEPQPLDPCRGSSPTVLRLVIGTQLRRLREAKGITREAAGEAIRASHAKISRLELGRVGFKERDVTDLLDLYGITADDEREAFLRLVRQANTPGWWHRYSDVLPGWFEMYVRLEQAASVIRSYQVQFVPGLFQTEGYARAIITADTRTESDDDVERRVNLRLTRQKLLTERQAPHFSAVLDEAALRRPYGGAKAMREQLEHLVALTELPNVTVQVLGFDAASSAAAAGPFTVLRFAEHDLPDVVYLEQLTGAVYLDKQTDVARYQAAMERVTAAASDPGESVALLSRIAREL